MGIGIPFKYIRGTRSLWHYMVPHFPGVAQLGLERVLWEHEVARSNRVTRTIKIKRRNHAEEANLGK